GDPHAAAGQAPRASLPHPSAPAARPVVSQSNSVRGTHLGLRPPAMNTDWNNVVVIDSRTLETLGQDCRKLRRSTRLLKGTLYVTLASAVVCGAKLEASSRRLGETEQGLRECRKSVTRSSGVLSALARSQEQILLATEQAPSVGKKIWGRRL